MQALKAEHIKSSRFPQDWPKVDLPEFAFVGRSNVGKSSLINMLVGIKGLARTSRTPGKTQNLEHFNVEDTWCLADLPGYGYAKVSRSERTAWQQMLRSYLRDRKNLVCVFLLIDARIKPQQSDLDMMRWMGEEGVPFMLVFTKCDKVKRSAMIGTIENYKTRLREEWEELPQIVLTSSESRRGRDEMLEIVAQIAAGV